MSSTADELHERWGRVSSRVEAMKQGRSQDSRQGIDGRSIPSMTIFATYLQTFIDPL